MGVPFGIALGRWGWHEVARQLGVDSRPVIPVLPLILIAAATVVVTGLLSLFPARRAAGLRPAVALRTE
jgi:ABC-type antimicrobial peptide transport system permease subunit